MTLHDAARPYQPPERTGDYRTVFGTVMSRDEALRLAAELHYRGDYDGGLRALEDADLTPHDLVAWAENG